MKYENSRPFAVAQDQLDPLRSYRDKFHYPKNDHDEEVLYFCGNSLGLQPKTVEAFIGQELDLWKNKGVIGQQERWISFHEKLEPQSAKLVGALSEEVVVMNALTVNIHLLLISFYQPKGNRHKILIEKGAFPSDQYAVESQLLLHGYDPEESLIEVAPRDGEKVLRTQDIISEIERHGDTVATIYLGGVNYLTGQVLDIEAITIAGKEHGAMVGFNLAHSAGNLPLKLHDWNVDFAAWCTYKYLCGGPGAPSGIFIHKRHHSWSGPRLVGWWGHDKKTRFKMQPNFDPIQGAEGWQISNAPIMGMAPLIASMEIFDEIGMLKIREKSKKLTGYLEFLINDIDLDISIITPKNKGCQLSLVVNNGEQLFKYLSNNNVVCDWREPDVIRIAPHPLYNRYSEVFEFVKLLDKDNSD